MVAQHERALQHVCKGARLLVPKHGLHEREMRSTLAELAEREKTIRAASAHFGRGLRGGTQGLPEISQISRFFSNFAKFKPRHGLLYTWPGSLLQAF